MSDEEVVEKEVDAASAIVCSATYAGDSKNYHKFEFSGGTLVGKIYLSKKSMPTPVDSVTVHVVPD